MVKYFSEKKDRDAKLLNEITTLKSRIKEDSETILEQKTEAKSSIKIRKSLEKKIDNLNHKVESLKTEKADLKREIQKLPRHSKLTKSVSIQTDDDPNNNLPIQPPSIQTISTSSQTILGHPRLTLDLLSESEASVSFECYVCNKVFHGACEIEEHANDDCTEQWSKKPPCPWSIKTLCLSVFCNVHVCLWMQCQCLSVDAMSILGPPAIQQWFAGLLIRGEVLVCEVLMQGVNVWKCVVKLMYGDVSQDKATNYI